MKVYPVRLIVIQSFSRLPETQLYVGHLAFGVDASPAGADSDVYDIFLVVPWGVSSGL